MQLTERRPVGAPRPRLLLLHGLASSSHAWDPLRPRLRSYDVLAPTLPGHHGGPPMSAEPSPMAYADWVEDLLDAQGWDTAHIVGNSLGGWISLELAARGRAESVLGLAPAGAWRHDRDQRRTQRLLIAANRIGRLPQTRAWLAGALPTGAGRRAALRLVMEHGERMTRTQAAEVMADARGCTAALRLLKGPVAEQFGGIGDPELPIRIIWGRQDRVLPWSTHGEPMMERLPHADLELLDDVGHVPMWDCPELVLTRIRDHADQRDRRRVRVEATPA